MKLLNRLQPDNSGLIERQSDQTYCLNYLYFPFQFLSRLASANFVSEVLRSQSLKPDVRFRSHLSIFMMRFQIQSVQQLFALLYHIFSYFSGLSFAANFLHFTLELQSQLKLPCPRIVKVKTQDCWLTKQKRIKHHNQGFRFLK